jgi:F0F1-type ATP synthase epsilon subunit
MNVIVTTMSGSFSHKAKLFVESGILIMDDGSVSCVTHEKQFNKTIVIEKPEVKKEEVKEASSPSIEQSEQGQEKKNKRKSK